MLSLKFFNFWSLVLHYPLVQRQKNGPKLFVLYTRKSHLAHVALEWLLVVFADDVHLKLIHIRELHEAEVTLLQSGQGRGHLLCCGWVWSGPVLLCHPSYSALPLLYLNPAQSENTMSSYVTVNTHVQ